MWLPPAIDLAFGDHNAIHVLRYFLHSHGETSGLSYGLGLLSGHVKLTGPWAGAPERYAFENLVPAALASLLILAVLLVILAALNMRGASPGCGDGGRGARPARRRRHRRCATATALPRLPRGVDASAGGVLLGGGRSRRL